MTMTPAFILLFHIGNYPVWQGEIRIEKEELKLLLFVDITNICVLAIGLVNF